MRGGSCTNSSWEGREQYVELGFMMCCRALPVVTHRPEMDCGTYSLFGG